MSYGRSSKTLLRTTYALVFGRDSRIRTCDLLLPKQMRYQAALCPVAIQATY